MKKFTVFYDYTMCGQIEIEADNLEEAIKKLEEDEELQRKNSAEDHYVDSSFTINRQPTETVNKE